MNEQMFLNQLKVDKIDFSDHQIDQLHQYLEFLTTANQTTNLTRIISPEDIYLKHFYDALTIVKHIDLKSINSLLDIGSGAGFPGMILAIFNPHIQVTLVDAVGKKTKFLEDLKKHLKLTNVTVVNGRVEERELFPNESFDMITARSVAKINILAELAARLIKINGYLVLQKSEPGLELSESQNALKKLKLKEINQHKFNLNGQDHPRTIIILEKTAKTPPTYPRHFSQIKKKPL